MRGVRIPQDLNGEDEFVLGLSVPRLAALLLGMLAAYTILHLTLPAPLQLAAAGMAALTGAAVAWVRPEGRSLIHWALAAVEFKLGQHIAPDAADNDPPHPDMDIDVAAAESAPVYLGGPQVITFFSAKGGTGRTTLATEVAALLAMKGRYRESPSSRPQPLRVVLIDFDLASANVSARVGIAQPTMLDYLCDLTVPHPDPRDYIVHHQATGLDVLLGPSKCLSGDRAELFGVPQAAHILSTLKDAGYQFLVLDMSANLGNLETYLLETATRIYCVVTPTAGSVQSLYRGVEALRRLGLGPKLHYVANKMRDGFNLSEPMGDLNGSLVAKIPYEPAFDTAENRHEPIALRSAGASGEALRHLAASVYPALQLPHPSRSRLLSFGWLSRSRRAG